MPREIAASQMTRACILGCSGSTLTAAERDFFRDARPWGFILFARNIEAPEQVRALTSSLREITGRAETPILIDQEGGRVQRMRPPHWPTYPPAAAFLRVAPGDGQKRRELARLGARLIAADLLRVGINVDCMPVLDAPQPGADAIIGDRAYSDEADEIARLGRAAAEGLIAGGVLPVIKHIPGHGRATADSHLALPVVDAPLTELRALDFLPFQANSDMPLAMTAHLVFKAIDPDRPGTQSRAVIDLIRSEIGFDGLLMTDDLSMQALSGDFATRASLALAAGCDVVLHCNGEMAEMEGVVAGSGELTGDAARRARSVMGRVAQCPEPFDEDEARFSFRQAMGL